MYCSIIRISNVQKSDEGTYEVCAKNREGEATNTLILNVTSKEPSKKPQKNEPPIIVKQLTPTVCKMGDSVKLETVITGTPTPKIEWAHNGSKISTTSGTMKMTEKDTIYSLVIDNVDQTFDGNYTVKAVNSSGSVQTSANLTVEGEVVEFEKTLEDIEVKETSSVEMNVETSEETANVQWYKDGEQIKKNDETYQFKKVGRKHSLIIKKASVHLDSEYTAVAGEQETTAELTVVELPPQFTKKIETKTVTAGEQEVIFETEITKGDAATKWLKNGAEIKPVESGPEGQKNKVKIDGKRQKLSICNVTTADAGEYTCTIGNEKCSAKLIVEEPKVNFVEKLQETTSGEIGQDIKITVKLSNPDAKVSWLREGYLIRESSKFSYQSDGASHTLIIKGATITDVGEYKCQAENVSCKTELEVKHKDEKMEIQKHQREQCCVKGQDIKFVVPFIKEYGSKPKAVWSFKNKTSTPSERSLTKVTRTPVY
jgi:hypothetical protein